MIILRHNPGQRVSHVGPDVGVPVLVQAQGAAGVLDEEVKDADAEGVQLGREAALDVVGDEVAACGAGG